VYIQNFVSKVQSVIPLFKGIFLNIVCLEGCAHYGLFLVVTVILLGYFPQLIRLSYLKVYHFTKLLGKIDSLCLNQFSFRISFRKFLFT
jgi:hypothetical protein